MFRFVGNVTFSIYFRFNTAGKKTRRKSTFVNEPSRCKVRDGADASFEKIDSRISTMTETPENTLRSPKLDGQKIDQTTCTCANLFSVMLGGREKIRVN
jgi:hypothetical protein